MTTEGPSPFPRSIRLAELDGRQPVSVVCVGDSLTGYNNFGTDWHLPTYPDFLQQLLIADGWPDRVLNGGQAGETSHVALQWTRRYLDLVSDSQWFVFGFGTNDLARLSEADTEAVSREILANLAVAIDLASDRGKNVVVFNVPHLNSSLFGRGTAARSRRIRDYHNGKLAEFCAARRLPLADVCSQLRDEHFADALHPNAAGARMIAEQVYSLLTRRRSE